MSTIPSTHRTSASPTTRRTSARSLPSPAARALLTMLVLLARVASGQGSVLLVGGGSEDYGDWSDRPYRWLVEQAPGGKILILHYATTSSFLPAYFQSLGAVSASNLVVASPEAADDSANYRAILDADGLFLRGGDQWEYVRLWKGTLVQKAIKELFLRGGAGGGRVPALRS